MQNKYEIIHCIEPVFWIYGLRSTSFYNNMFKNKKDLYLDDEIYQIIENVTKINNSNLIEKHITDRIDLYNSLLDLKDIMNIGSKKNNLKNRDEYVYYYFDLDSITEGVNIHVWNIEFTQFYIMMLLAKNCPSIATWILQNETKLLLKRLYAYFVCNSSPKTYEIISTLIQFFYEEDEINITSFSINCNWKIALDLMSSQQHYHLDHGYVVFNYPYHNYKQDVSFNDPIYSHINLLLSTRYYQIMKKYIDSITLTPSFNISQYSELQKFIIENEIITMDVHNSITNIDTEIIPCSPLCIVDLDEGIQNGSDPGYYGSLQLSFYMKQFFVLNDLKQYFFIRDARNRKYKSIEDMYRSNPKLASHMKQQYKNDENNEEKNSYKPSQCINCQSGNICYFSRDVNNIVDDLSNRYINVLLCPKTECLGMEFIQRIKSAGLKKFNKFYSYACGLEMYLRVLQLCQMFDEANETENPNYANPILDQLFKSESTSEFIEKINKLINKKIPLSIYTPINYYIRSHHLISNVSKNITNDYPKKEESKPTIDGHTSSRSRLV